MKFSTGRSYRGKREFRGVVESLESLVIPKKDSPVEVITSLEIEKIPKKVQKDTFLGLLPGWWKVTKQLLFANLW